MINAATELNSGLNDLDLCIVLHIVLLVGTTWVDK